MTGRWVSVSPEEPMTDDDTPAPPSDARTCPPSHVICPGCSHDFRAVSVEDQERIAEATARANKLQTDVATEYLRGMDHEQAARANVENSHIRSLKDALAAAEAKLAALEAAMDWLSRHVFERKWGGTIGRPSTWHMAGPHRHQLAKMRGDTLLDAIDSARATQQEKP